METTGIIRVLGYLRGVRRGAWVCGFGGSGLRDLELSLGHLGSMSWSCQFRVLALGLKTQ